MPELKLYYKPTCGFCRKVVRFITDNQLPVELRNVRESSAIWEVFLAATNNYTQVPCLLIDGEPMYESDDIIEWLAANGGKS